MSWWGGFTHTHTVPDCPDIVADNFLKSEGQHEILSKHVKVVTFLASKFEHQKSGEWVRGIFEWTLQHNIYVPGICLDCSNLEEPNTQKDNSAGLREDCFEKMPCWHWHLRHRDTRTFSDEVQLFACLEKNPATTQHSRNWIQFSANKGVFFLCRPFEDTSFSCWCLWTSFSSLPRLLLRACSISTIPRGIAWSAHRVLKPMPEKSNVPIHTNIPLDRYYYILYIINIHLNIDIPYLTFWGVLKTIPYQTEDSWHGVYHPRSAIARWYERFRLKAVPWTQGGNPWRGYTTKHFYWDTRVYIYIYIHT